MAMCFVYMHATYEYTHAAGTHTHTHARTHTHTNAQRERETRRIKQALFASSSTITPANSTLALKSFFFLFSFFGKHLLRLGQQRLQRQALALPASCYGKDSFSDPARGLAFCPHVDSSVPCRKLAASTSHFAIVVGRKEGGIENKPPRIVQLRVGRRRKVLQIPVTKWCFHLVCDMDLG
jgi:hypothetical protein